MIICPAGQLKGDTVIDMNQEFKFGECVIISDLHIRQSDDERCQKLLYLLENLQTESTQTLILMGDVFDFFYGGQPYFQKKFEAVQLALGQLKQRGIRVIFIEGNHEFALDHKPWPGVEFIKQGSLILNLSDGKTLKCTHGDMIDPPMAYRVFRAFVKSRFILYIARWIPGAWLDAYGLGHSSYSRS